MDKLINFKEEITTVWSFPEREGATHMLSTREILHPNCEISF